MTGHKLEVQSAKCKVQSKCKVGAKYFQLTFNFALCTLHLLCVALPAAAQTNQVPDTARAASGDVVFLSRFDYVFGLEFLASDDPRFDFDATFGGALDLIDYTRGRLTFEAEYEAILGNEYQPFDPNQGNYKLAGVLSARARSVEVAVVYHHVSRHLGDRPKRVPIDWNMLGARLRSAIARGGTELEMRADVRGAVLHTYVDYTWELDAQARARVRLTDRTAFVASGGLRVVGVDGSRARGTQYGARAEGGVRLDGSVAAVELFVAAERRIDPYPLAFGTASWVIGGFRLVNR